MILYSRIGPTRLYSLTKLVSIPKYIRSRRVHVDFKTALKDLRQYKPIFFNCHNHCTAGSGLVTIPSCGIDSIFQTPGEVVEVLGTFLPNRVNSARGHFR